MAPSSTSQTWRSGSTPILTRSRRAGEGLPNGTAMFAACMDGCNGALGRCWSTKRRPTAFLSARAYSWCSRVQDGAPPAAHRGASGHVTCVRRRSTRERRRPPAPMRGLDFRHPYANAAGYTALQTYRPREALLKANVPPMLRTVTAATRSLRRPPSTRPRSLTLPGDYLRSLPPKPFVASKVVELPEARAQPDQLDNGLGSVRGLTL